MALFKPSTISTKQGGTWWWIPVLCIRGRWRPTMEKTCVLTVDASAAVCSLLRDFNIGTQ